jgi:hypothetical protein
MSKLVWSGTFTSTGYEGENGKINLLLPSDLSTLMNSSIESVVVGNLIYSSSYKTNAVYILHLSTKEPRSETAYLLHGFSRNQEVQLSLNIESALSGSTTIDGTYNLPLPEDDSGTISLIKTNNTNVDSSIPKVECSIM